MRNLVRSFILAFLSLFFLAPDPLSGQIVLSEFGAANVLTFSDEDGDSEDWIELSNVSTPTVNLEGWRLTDELGTPDKWQLPSTNLAPGPVSGRICLRQRQTHTRASPAHQFQLAAGGEYLALVRPDGTIATAYAPAFPPQAIDVSYGLPPGSSVLSLVGSGSPARFQVPQDAVLGLGLDGPGF